MKTKTLLAFSLLLAMSLGALLSAQADSPAAGRNGRAEVRFLQGMIDHHQIALDMRRGLPRQSALLS
jgi:uncharacterized protein (DUF305 family)